MTYRIDARDVVCELGEEWLLSEDNAEGEDVEGSGRAAADPRTILGRPIWEFIAGEETRQLYQMIFQRVRCDKKTLELPFRCDAPAARHFMRLTFRPLPEDGIEVSSALEREERREPARVLDSAAPRAEGSRIEVCSWCKKFGLDGGRWVEVEEAMSELDLWNCERMPRLAHSVCPDCRRLLSF